MARVLVIDDDDAVRTAIKLLLETDGYDPSPEELSHA